MTQGMNVKNLKERNKSLILYTLNDAGEISRKELAARTGLTPAAVTKLTAELIEDGYICEKGAVESEKSGRRERPLSLRLEDKKILGINAERDGITFCVCDLGGRALKKLKTPLFEDIEDVLKVGKRFLADSGIHVIAVGVCVIGSPTEGFAVWKGEGLEKRFAETFGMTTVIENNVRAFAEAELIFGNIRNHSSVLFFKWGPGVGSSIIANGRVLSGGEGNVAEIGHYIVKEGGRKCRCGRRGCLEAEASSDAIREELAAYKGPDRQGELRRVVDEKLKLVVPALLNTATILNAQEVVLFGGMFENADAARRLNELIGGYFGGFRDAKVSALNEKRDYIGAVAICAQRLFFNAE